MHTQAWELLDKILWKVASHLHMLQVKLNNLYLSDGTLCWAVLWNTVQSHQEKSSEFECYWPCRKEQEMGQ